MTQDDEVKFTIPRQLQLANKVCFSFLLNFHLLNLPHNLFRFTTFFKIVLDNRILFFKSDEKPFLSNAINRLFLPFSTCTLSGSKGFQMLIIQKYLKFFARRIRILLDLARFSRKIMRNPTRILQHRNPNTI